MTVTVDSEFQAYAAGLQRERDALVTALENLIRSHYHSRQEHRLMFTQYAVLQDWTSATEAGDQEHQHELILAVLFTIRRAWHKAQRGEG